MKRIANKWTLLVCAVALAAVVAVRWDAFLTYYYFLRTGRVLTIHESRVFLDLKAAGISTEHLSFHPKTGTSLRLEGASVTNIVALEPFKLEFGNVALIDTKVTDLSPLAGSYVWGLDLRGSPITNLAVLSTMKDLEHLTLSRQQITENLAVLRNLRASIGTNGINFSYPHEAAWVKEYDPPPPGPALR
ncbi:MAG: hypothetical protein RLY20_3181 [Verrucomicrobiota bacterium]|jgi:hypothetical protein